ncbi:MAG: hypothetical protein OXG25_08965 [Gammaproteobacteria bacterium]|nr:hypothetical protein [Gammaproteobacteria bacterium]
MTLTVVHYSGFALTEVPEALVTEAEYAHLTGIGIFGGRFIDIPAFAQCINSNVYLCSSISSPPLLN